MEANTLGSLIPRATKPLNREDVHHVVRLAALSITGEQAIYTPSTPTVECRNGSLVHKDGGIAVPLVDGEVAPRENHVVVGADGSCRVKQATINAAIVVDG